MWFIWPRTLAANSPWIIVDRVKCVCGTRNEEYNNSASWFRFVADEREVLMKYLYYYLFSFVHKLRLDAINIWIIHPPALMLKHWFTASLRLFSLICCNFSVFFFDGHWTSRERCQQYGGYETKGSVGFFEWLTFKVDTKLWKTPKNFKDHFCCKIIIPFYLRTWFMT